MTPIYRTRTVYIGFRFNRLIGRNASDLAAKSGEQKEGHAQAIPRLALDNAQLHGPQRSSNSIRSCTLTVSFLSTSGGPEVTRTTPEDRRTIPSPAQRFLCSPQYAPKSRLSRSSTSAAGVSHQTNRYSNASNSGLRGFVRRTSKVKRESPSERTPVHLSHGEIASAFLVFCGLTVLSTRFGQSSLKPIC